MATYSFTDLQAEFAYGDTLPSANMRALRDNLRAIPPVGSITAYMGDTAPDRYLECDGSSLNRVTYADLFAVIGVKFGSVDGSSFNLPDLRGEFLRGYDNSAGTDPDAATRTDRGDGTTGDAIGTKQASDNKTHTHDVSGNNFIVTGAGTGYTNIGTGGTLVYYSAATLASGNANEARPTNISVMWIIRY